MVALLSKSFTESIAGKDLLYKDLEENEPRLINDLKTTEHENVMDKVKVSNSTNI